MAVLPTGIGPVTGGYQIERSLRFNSADTAYLSRTPASASNRTTWTWSGWIKRSSLGAGNFFAASNGSNIQFYAAFNSNDTIGLVDYTSAININLNTTQVFRDVGAWAHFVISMDTTQATASNRLKFYVNGSQVTVFSTATYPTQNYNTAINSTVLHAIGREEFADLYYLNGYMTEVNFIDGQALTPSSFGETDSNTGVWKPKAYTGTYGTNGFYLPFKTASQWSGYFDGNGDDLTAPSNAAFTYGTGDFTIEGFFFFTGGVGAGGYSYLFAQGGTSGSTSTIGVYSQSGVYKVWNGSTVITGTAAFAQNQWVHIALTRSGTTLRLFVNGVLDGSATNSNSIASGGTSGISIGRWKDISDTNYITGYVSNFRVVKGTAVYTSAFTPPTSQLTAITNTSLLTCQSSTFVDNSTNAFTITASGDARPQQFSPFTLDVTDDHSGQGNHWIPNNLDLRTTGAGADIMVDSPTNYGSDTGVGGTVRGNYCTLNPLLFRYAVGAGTLTNGNLQATGSSTYFFSTFQMPATGKWYFEGVPTAGSSTPGIGLGDLAVASTVFTNQVQYLNDGNKNVNGSQTAYGASYTTNDVIGVAVDCDAGTITFYKNNASQGAITTTVRNQFVFLQTGGSWTWVMNFGQRAFAYTAPSGFKALCTQNLPPVAIGATSTTQANKYMDVTLYTGNGAVRSITNSGSMQPDFVWDKLRSGSNSHRLFDAVRGVEKALYSNLTNAEATETGTITSFNSNGFSLGTSTETNTNGSTYVAWQWSAGGSTVTNTSGTISSQVRANTTSGFSIVTYTGNGTNGATVGHGLGTTPAMVIIKSRSLTGSTPSASWIVWHRSISQAIQTGTTIALTGFTGATVLNSTAQSTTYGFDAQVNGSTQTYVAYCFAPVDGYSAFGSYTGNGAADGPFVYTGFRPRYVLIKKTATGTGNGEWYVHDTARDDYNQARFKLYPSSTVAENGVAGETTTTNAIDILSNGFKLRTLNGATNESAIVYIYAAFAEHPFKYSLAR